MSIRDYKPKDKPLWSVPYVPECEQLGNERTDYCTACDSYKNLEAERDAAVKLLETVLNIQDMSDADLEQLRLNCKAAIDAARGEA